MSPHSDRDAGFCSGGSELGDERLSDSPNSQIDVSDDSIEVKIPHIILSKNKRKNSEPAKVVETEMGPLKKRIRFQQFLLGEKSSNISKDKSLDESNNNNSCKSDKNEKKPTVFRPWTVEGPSEKKSKESRVSPPLIQIPEVNPADVLLRHPGVTTLHRAAPIRSTTSNEEQIEPLALVVERKEISSRSNNLPQNKKVPSSLSKSNNNNKIRTTHTHETSSKSSTSTTQRNYKNMTRERRIEANARERTRVHTISAAYEKLRKCIPSYSSSHKLSKLAVLRIAGAYILALSRMMGDDLSADGSQPDVNECIDAVRNILEREGKVKKDEDTD